jgi:hypothetical protein
VEGWRPVEDLVRWGFAHAPVVMANEAHNRAARCIRTREVGVRMIRAAHEAGVRRLALEALNWPAPGTPGPITALPEPDDGYLGQPEMRTLMATALDLGWTLWAYDAVIELRRDQDVDWLVSMEFTNWRERQQATNLGQLVAGAPAEPLLVWYGGGHASKRNDQEWVPMGWHFRERSGVDPFVIDQIVTVTFGSEPQPWVSELLASLAGTLAGCGGAAGILTGQAPAPLNLRTDVDAMVVSDRNELTPDSRWPDDS